MLIFYSFIKYLPKYTLKGDTYKIFKIKFLFICCFDFFQVYRSYGQLIFVFQNKNKGAGAFCIASRNSSIY